MTRWEPVCWCLIGVAAAVVFGRSWRTADLVFRSEPGFVSRETNDVDGRERRYTLYVPREHDGTRRLPLIVFLHGIDGTGSDGRQQLKTGLAPEVASRHRSGRPFPYFVLFPQSDHQWRGSSSDVQAVLGLVDEVERNYPIDPERVFLTAIADGVVALWDLAARFPERWAGIVPIASMTRQVDEKRVGSIPTRWYQNTGEAAAWVRETVASLRAAGGSIDLIELDDQGRDAWSRAYADEGLFAWLARQRRRAAADSRIRESSPG